MKDKKTLKKREGAALVFVLITIIVVGILSMSMATIFSANLNQSKYQQYSLEAYYLAYSAALIAYEGLLANNYNKLDELRGGGTLTTQNINFDNGKATVTAVISTDTNLEDFIKIVSTAKLSRNNFKYTRILYFDPDNPLDMLWKNN